MINRQKTLDAFAAYVRNYNAKDPKVDLKIRHTIKVAEISEEIAKTVEGVDIDIAWLAGMLHDIGRFEQLRLYDTFIDADSVDHATFGCKLLYEDGLAEKMYEDRSLDELLKSVIEVHNKYRIPAELEQEYLPYAKILRDADKIDIIRANLETPLTDIYNVTEEELYDSLVTDAVMDNFLLRQATPRALKKVAVDHVVGHISLTFELEYPKSLSLMKHQGYLERLMAFPSRNPETRKQFSLLREIIDDFWKDCE